MIRMELVGDPNNFEDKFVRVEIDDEVSVHRQTEFVLDVEGNKKSIQPRQIPFYQVKD
tara:strand:- start:1324 stop:1497 length:174 start_codon:yes stop_codon:yes gene_type:complete